MRRALLLVCAALAAGCRSPTDEGGAIASVVVSPASVTLDAIGAERTLLAEARDSNGGVVVDAVPAWSSSDPLVAAVTPLGAVVAASPGTAIITATVGGASGSSQVTVAPVPVALEGVSGDRQVGGAGEPLAAPLVVRALDRLGGPVAGANVSFVPTVGSGSVDPSQATSDASGVAAATWTLGPSLGGQSLSASLQAGPSVLFSATATSQAGLSIELEYLTPPTVVESRAFDQAIQRWAELIPGRLQPVAVQFPGGGCGSSSPAINRVINDLLIFVTIDSIDGERGTLGRTGLCGVRAASGLPVLARMTLDKDDVERLEAAGRLVDMVLHELAHALGLGTLWASQGLLADPSVPNNPGSDVHFTGATAIQAFDSIGGASYGGAKVPVENTGSTGTRDRHWRASVLPTELMTGFLNADLNPLSRVTVASLGDLGYRVNEGAADAYQIALAAVGPSPSPREPIAIGDDIQEGPLYVIAPDGALLGVIEH